MATPIHFAHPGTEFTWQCSAAMCVSMSDLGKGSVQTGHTPMFLWQWISWMVKLNTGISFLLWKKVKEKDKNYWGIHVFSHTSVTSKGNLPCTVFGLYDLSLINTLSLNSLTVFEPTQTPGKQPLSLFPFPATLPDHGPRVPVLLTFWINLIILNRTSRSWRLSLGSALS